MALNSTVNDVAFASRLMLPDQTSTGVCCMTNQTAEAIKLDYDSAVKLEKS